LDSLDPKKMSKNEEKVVGRRGGQKRENCLDLCV